MHALSLKTHHWQAGAPMSGYWTGYQMGQQAAQAQNSAANLGHAFARALSGVPALPPLQQQIDQLKTDLNGARAGRSAADAAILALRDCFSRLPSASQQQLLAVLEAEFVPAFLRHSASAGLQYGPGQEAVVAASWKKFATGRS
ncbi:hypothetical protein K678_03517 [Magnetospirillum fulvum MGU-K5]|uniref:Uncharacterized protein n=1 Tax=Magnetospirillum fulvum MGU-K5 TaxID=1316936 RepID=S9SFT8_MAGFU|nr:hypothetical protein K678_03517 [Magnetospirillum fulvum MGU-K5]